MTFINIPVEWFSIGFDWTWMLLFGDIRQGIFYAMLLSFWIIFCGEHMMVRAPGKGQWMRQNKLAVTGVSSGVKPSVQIPTSPLTSRPLASDLISLNPRFPIYKMGFMYRVFVRFKRE